MYIYNFEGERRERRECSRGRVMKTKSASTLFIYFLYYVHKLLDFITMSGLNSIRKFANS
jgi:hypothetical protein